MGHKKTPEYGFIFKKGKPVSYVFTPQEEEKIAQIALEIQIRNIPWMIEHYTEVARREAEAARIKSLEPPKTLAQKLSDLINPRKT